MDALYLIVIAPCLFLTGICVLIYATIQKKLPICDGRDILDRLSAAICLQLPNTHFHEMVLWSGRYKDKVLAQPASINGGLKHIEWDGWGWGGQDFSVFLVFDPADSLSGPAKSRQSGKLNGIPCEVSSVRRMDSHWYIVFFDGYVDQSSWDSCK